MTLEKLHDDAETKRAQKDIESALNITETKEEDEDSNRIVVYDRSRSTASSTKPLASKPKKTNHVSLRRVNCQLKGRQRPRLGARNKNNEKSPTYCHLIQLPSSKTNFRELY